MSASERSRDDGGDELSVSTRVLRALDELDIQSTLNRYARGVDRSDWVLLRSCYTEDATDEHGRYNGGLDGLIDWLSVEMRRYESTMHVIGNTLIDVKRPGAWAETYCVAYHRLHPNEQGLQHDRTLGVRYIDAFRLEDGAWRICHRRCVYEWMRMDAVSPGSALEAAYVRGRRGPSDPSHGFLLG
jgi:hypothetical protein